MASLVPVLQVVIVAVHVRDGQLLRQRCLACVVLHEKGAQRFPNFLGSLVPTHNFDLD
jgi:hypothetical protein